MAETGEVTDKSSFERLKDWAKGIKRDVIALWLAARDPRVSWYAKVLAASVAAYALSPIDLIPDFVPILGYLDDLLIVPLGIWDAIKLVSQALMAEFRAQAQNQCRPMSNVGLAIVVSLWLFAVTITVWFLWPTFGNRES